MSRVDEYGPEPEGEDLLAAEYVLGVLPASERQAAARRVETDPEFAGLVDAWEVRLSPLGAQFTEQTPPAGAKTAIDGKLFSTASVSGARGGLWRSLALWRGLTIAALAALVIAVAIPFVATPPDEDQPTRLVASLSAEDSDVHYFVVYDGTRHEVGLSHVTGERDAGRDFELWVIAGQNPPDSLGVIPAGSNVRLDVTPQMREKIETGAVFAISMEPQGGSPTGQPTGPVVAAGDLKTI